MSVYVIVTVLLKKSLLSDCTRCQQMSDEECGVPFLLPPGASGTLQCYAKLNSNELTFSSIRNRVMYVIVNRTLLNISLEKSQFADLASSFKQADASLVEVLGAYGGAGAKDTSCNFLPCTVYQSSYLPESFTLKINTTTYKYPDCCSRSKLVFFGMNSKYIAARLIIASRLSSLRLYPETPRFPCPTQLHRQLISHPMSVLFLFSPAAALSPLSAFRCDPGLPSSA